jgi:hypothetical protein
VQFSVCTKRSIGLDRLEIARALEHNPTALLNGWQKVERAWVWEIAHACVGDNELLRAATQKASSTDVVMIPTGANGQPRDALPPSCVQMELLVPPDQEAVQTDVIGCRVTTAV